jgi:peptidoglycan/xylan/chitin deacetylase (PgdA/CDA1 family)
MAKSKLNSTLFPRSGYRLRGVPVFLYHGIARTNNLTRAEGRKYCITPEQFRSQLEVIQSQRYAVATLANLWEPERQTKEDDRSTVITFDDGQASNYEEAFAVLQQFNYRAEFFLNPGTVNRPGFLTWSQIAEMHRAGMSFQSHGWDHVDLSVLPSQELDHQLRDSKQELELRLGSRVDVLSAPYGLLNTRIVRAALDMGYRAVCSSRNWPAQPGKCVIDRVAVYAHTTTAQAARLLSGNPCSYGLRTVRAELLGIPKRLLLAVRPNLLTVRRSGAEA